MADTDRPDRDTTLHTRQTDPSRELRRGERGCERPLEHSAFLLFSFISTSCLHVVSGQCATLRDKDEKSCATLVSRVSASSLLVLQDIPPPPRARPAPRSRRSRTRTASPSGGARRSESDVREGARTDYSAGVAGACSVAAALGSSRARVVARGSSSTGDDA